MFGDNNIQYGDNNVQYGDNNVLYGDNNVLYSEHYGRYKLMMSYASNLCYNCEEQLCYYLIKGVK